MPLSTRNPESGARLIQIGPFFQVEHLKRFSYLSHVITRRRPGDSFGDEEFDFKVSDDSQTKRALRNRTLLAKGLGVSMDDMIWFDPTEGGDVRWVSAENLGCGAEDWNTRLLQTSGIVGQCSNMILCTLTNDNTVVMLFDPQWYTIGLVSLDPNQPSGAPLDRAVQLMSQEGGANPKQMICAIASGIGPCCFNLKDADPEEVRGQTNMWDLARTSLQQSGLLKKNIYNSRTCTACRDTEFFSRKIDGPSSGCGAAALGVKDSGGFSQMLAARRTHTRTPVSSVQEEDAKERDSLILEEQRLNKAMRCPHGENKVYIRSLLTGRTDKASKPELALRCAVMEHVGQAMGGYNVVDKAYIQEYCCGDYESCPAFVALRRRRRKQ